MLEEVAETVGTGWAVGLQGEEPGRLPRGAKGVRAFQAGATASPESRGGAEQVLL